MEFTLSESLSSRMKRMLFMVLVSGLTIFGTLAFADSCEEHATAYHKAFSLERMGYPKTEFVFWDFEEGNTPTDVMIMKLKTHSLGLKGRMQSVWMKDPGWGMARLYHSYKGVTIDEVPETWSKENRERFQTLKSQGVVFFVPTDFKWGFGQAVLLVKSGFVKGKAQALVLLKPSEFMEADADHEMQHALDVVADIDRFLGSLPPAPSSPVEALEAKVKDGTPISLLTKLRLKAILSLPGIVTEVNAYERNLKYACSVEGRRTFRSAPFTAANLLYQEYIMAGWYSILAAGTQTAVNPVCKEAAKTYGKAVAHGASWVLFAMGLGKVAALILN